MLRRFSTNFALLSMLIDMLTVIASMVQAADLRPSMVDIFVDTRGQPASLVRRWFRSFLDT